jgi:signal peptidase
MTGTDDGDEGGILTARRRALLVRAGHVLGILLLLAVVVPVIIYLVPQVVGAEYSYVVLSGSMEPALSPGDVAVVDAVGAGAVDRGDIINFQHDEETRTTTHRVIEIVERDGGLAFRTKGDNNEDPDQTLVTPEELRGRVMSLGGIPFAIPLVGYAIWFAGTQSGFVLLFVVPVGLLVLNEVWNVVSSASATDSDEPAAPEPPGSDAEPEPDPAAGDDEPSAGVTFTPTELRLGIAILAAFAAYSVAVAVFEPGVWTIGVAGSTTVGLLLLGGLYLSGRSTDETQTADSSLPEEQVGEGPDHGDPEGAAND